MRMRFLLLLSSDREARARKYCRTLKIENPYSCEYYDEIYIEIHKIKF